MQEERLETRLLRPIDENFNVEAVIRGTTFKRSLLDDLSVTPDGDDINLWLARQPAKTAYWRIWSGVSSIAVEDAKRRYDKTAGKARIAARERDKQRMKDEMAEWGKMPSTMRNQLPKPSAKTVDDISAEVENEPEVEAAWVDYMYARDVHNVMEASFKAIDSLRSSLVTLAANMRSEQSSFSNKFKGQEDGMQASTFVKRRSELLDGVREVSNDVKPYRPPPATASVAVESFEDIEMEEQCPLLDFEEPKTTPSPNEALVFAIVNDDLTKIASRPDQKKDD